MLYVPRLYESLSVRRSNPAIASYRIREVSLCPRAFPRDYTFEGKIRHLSPLI
jgi:hypothetical protein